MEVLFGLSAAVTFTNVPLIRMIYWTGQPTTVLGMLLSSYGFKVNAVKSEDLLIQQAKDILKNYQVQ